MTITVPKTTREKAGAGAATWTNDTTARPCTADKAEHHSGDEACWSFRRTDSLEAGVEHAVAHLGTQSRVGGACLDPQLVHGLGDAKDVLVTKGNDQVCQRQAVSWRQLLGLPIVQDGNSAA